MSILFIKTKRKGKADTSQTRDSCYQINGLKTYDNPT